MKIKCFGLLLSCLLLFSNLGVAKPLIGSEFARDNPGQIPFSQCYFENFAFGYMGALIGLGFGHDLVWLKCYSKQHDITSKIPVKLGPTLRLGLGAGAALGATLDVKLDNLDGKTINDLFGFYQGGSTNWLFVNVMGMPLEKHCNPHGISIRKEAATLGADVTIGCYSGFRVTHCDSKECYAPGRNDPEVLYARTFYERDDKTYFSQTGEGDNQTVQLATSSGDFLLSLGGQISFNEIKGLLSNEGENIHLLSGSDKMILLEKDNALSYQTLEGTSMFRLANEMQPDYAELASIRFVKDE